MASCYVIFIVMLSITTAMGSPRVKVSQGVLEGRAAISPSGQRYNCFQGIPYAKPPVGNLRFKDPVPGDKWNGILEATCDGNICPQISYDSHGRFIGNEDCLYLNVFTPETSYSDVKLPVMVWIHGGAFIGGSGGIDAFGPDFIIEKHVILVTINYRLAALGFLCLENEEVPGNAGLKDQALSLKWIHDNIHHFGGDSKNVTIFSESAGAASAMYLIVSPMTRGLKHRASIQSGSALCYWARQTKPFEIAIKLANTLGFKSSDKKELLKFLQKVSVGDIIKAAFTVLSDDDVKKFYTTAFLPVVERKFPGVKSLINSSPKRIIMSGDFESIPIMVGFSAKESVILFDRVKNDVNRVSEMISDFQHYVPAEMKLEWDSEKSINIASKIRNFYFGDKPIDHDTAENAVDLLSDVVFIRGLDFTVDILSKYSTAPVYFYKFSYLGNLNHHKSSLKLMNISQAGHCDETDYIFKKDSLADIELELSDELMRNRLIQMWTDFAKYGNPTPSLSPLITTKWQPVTKGIKNYLDIGDEITLGVGPNSKSLDFWKSLKYKHKDDI